VNTIRQRAAQLGVVQFLPHLNCLVRVFTGLVDTGSRCLQYCACSCPSFDAEPGFVSSSNTSRILTDFCNQRHYILADLPSFPPAITSNSRTASSGTYLRTKTDHAIFQVEPTSDPVTHQQGPGPQRCLCRTRGSLNAKLLCHGDSSRRRRRARRREEEE